MNSFFEIDDCVFRIDKIYRVMSQISKRTYTDRRQCELMYKISGSSDQIFGDRALRLVPNSLYFIPDSRRSNTVKVDVPGEDINIHFDVAFPCTDDLVPEVFVLPESNRIGSLYEKILTVWKSKSPSFRLEVKAIFIQILLEVRNLRSNEYLSMKTYRLVQPAFELIEREYSRAIQVPELARLCGISGTYLRRLFDVFKQRSPIEYLRYVRLHAAKELLVNTSMSVTDIARAVGFDDPHYFSRIYSREFGEPPSVTANKSIG